MPKPKLERSGAINNNYFKYQNKFGEFEQSTFLAQSHTWCSWLKRVPIGQVNVPILPFGWHMKNRWK